MPRRGDSVAKATDLFTIHYSLFTKKLSLFHIGWYFEEVPTVNPSVKNQRFLPAPFSKGAFGCGIDTGRVREVAIRRKPPCAMTAAARRPFGKGAFGCAAGVNACTVPMFSFPILLGNDTGRWRGSNDLQKITVRNCPRGHPGLRGRSCLRFWGRGGRPGCWPCR